MAAYTAHTDQQLTDLLKSGDQLAFSEIYSRYSGVIYMYAFKLTADADVAKDITQELFISLWDLRESTAFKTSLSSYLYTAVKYKFLKQVAHQKVRKVYAEKFLLTMEGAASSTDMYLEEKDLIKTIERLVLLLPPKMARAFILSKLQFRTHEEIAVELGVSEKTVKNLISQAVTQLKPKIGMSVLTVILLS